MGKNITINTVFKKNNDLARHRILTLIMAKKLTFIDLFSGIGGFHLALHNLGMECVLASEIDKHARLTYELNFKKVSPNLFKKNLFNDDVRTIKTNELQDFDILAGGFPCQPFSQAGFKKGFDDSDNDRGNMFFEIMRIAKAKKPKVLLLENVRHLVNHENGRTFRIIQQEINKLGYNLFWKVVKASEHGLPQHRPRVYIVCFRKDLGIVDFEFPEPKKLKTSMSDVFGGKCNKEIGFTLRVGGKASGLKDRRNWDTYLVDGKITRLNSYFGRKMMGFPDNFEFPVSETQAMKQLGNSVAVNCVYDIGLAIKEALNSVSMPKRRSKPVQIEMPLEL